MDHKVADIKKYFDNWIAAQINKPKDKSDLWKIIAKLPNEGEKKPIGKEKPIGEETLIDIAMEIHGACFGELNFFIDSNHAYEWIGSVENAFKMISWVQEYEMENLDEIKTDLSDAVDTAYSYMIYKALEEAITMNWLVDTMTKAELANIDKGKEYN